MLDWHEILGFQRIEKILSLKHIETLKKIFMNPTPPNIPWYDIQGLLKELEKELGGRIEEVFGGRIRVKLDDGTRGEIHQADLLGVTAIGNVREVREVIKSALIKRIIVITNIESTVVGSS